MDDYDALDDFDFEQTLGPGPLPPSAPAFSTAVPAPAAGAAAAAEPSVGPGGPGGNFGARPDGFGTGSAQHPQPPYQQQQQFPQHPHQQHQQPHQQPPHDMGGHGGGHGGAHGGPPPPGGGFRRNYRQTVCRHWLRGLCMKGAECGFLHQYDKSRMPVCRYFARWGECREPDCVYKHTNEDVKECNMYVMRVF
ncbi:hypothetical protein CLOP_g16781 [Closterium sp. NIES-67]|nr:hypothetical protein CLOP_g16781 [Closterium sp. NIES-67]